MGVVLAVADRGGAGDGAARGGAGCGLYEGGEGGGGDQHGAFCAVDAGGLCGGVGEGEVREPAAGDQQWRGIEGWIGRAVLCSRERQPGEAAQPVWADGNGGGSDVP